MMTGEAHSAQRIAAWDAWRMTEANPAPSLPVYLRQNALLVALCLAGAALGRQLTVIDATGTMMWPPGGIALGALLLYGTRLWPGVFVSTAVYIVFLTKDPLLGIGVAVMHTLEVVINAVVLRRFAGFRNEMNRLWDVGALIIVVALVSAIGALIFGGATWLGGWVDKDDLAMPLWYWWRGDVGGAFAFAPFVILARTGSPAWSVLAARKEFWLIATLLAVTLYLAFSGATTGEAQVFFGQLPLTIMLWAGARLGTRGAVVLALPSLLVTLLATANGVGPFVTVDPGDRMSLVWFYCFSLSGVGLVVAATISERGLAELQIHREAMERLRSERDRLLLLQRERIMREMHDGLGGQLVSVLSMVQRGMARPEEIAAGLQQALTEMWIMMDALERSEEGLAGQLDELRMRLEPILRRNGIELEWRVDPAAPIEGVGPEAALQCLRIVQQAITNVIQHAQAQRVRVAVRPGEAGDPAITIEIADDGIAGKPDPTSFGRGMQNMLTRARDIGGELRFEAAEPGTRVCLVLPVQARVDRPGFPGDTAVS